MQRRQKPHPQPRISFIPRKLNHSRKMFEKKNAGKGRRKKRKGGRALKWGISPPSDPNSDKTTTSWKWERNSIPATDREPKRLWRKAAKWLCPRKGENCEFQKKERTEGKAFSAKLPEGLGRGEGKGEIRQASPERDFRAQRWWRVKKGRGSRSSDMTVEGSTQVGIGRG